MLLALGPGNVEARCFWSAVKARGILAADLTPDRGPEEQAPGTQNPQALPACKKEKHLALRTSAVESLLAGLVWARGRVGSSSAKVFVSVSKKKKARKDIEIPQD